MTNTPPSDQPETPQWDAPAGQPTTSGSHPQDHPQDTVGQPTNQASHWDAPAADASQSPWAMEQPPPGYVPGPRATPVRPKTLTNAVYAMYAGAVVSVIGVIVGALTMGNLRDQVTKANPNLDKATVDATVTASVAFIIVGAIVAAALWVLMAIMNGKGKKWARIVGTVLFGISLVSFALSFVQATPVASRVVSIVSILIGAAATFFMWQRPSSDYYEDMSQPATGYR